MTCLKYFGVLCLSRKSITFYSEFQQTQAMRHTRQATEYFIYSVHIQSVMPVQYFHCDKVHQNRSHSSSFKRHDWWDESTLHTDRRYKLFVKPSCLLSESSCLFLSTAIPFWHPFSSIENSDTLILFILNHLLRF